MIKMDLLDALRKAGKRPAKKRVGQHGNHFFPHTLPDSPSEIPTHQRVRQVALPSVGGPRDPAWRRVVAVENPRRGAKAPQTPLHFPDQMLPSARAFPWLARQ